MARRQAEIVAKHSLDPLLKPTSIALLGASARDGSPGQVLADMVLNSKFSGHVYPVNPGYESIAEHRCYPDLNSLPETVDHVVLAVANERLEQALGDAISHGAKAATIYSSCHLDNDSEPPLVQRLSDMAREAGIAICGGNGMGFYNVAIDLYAGIFPRPGDSLKGGISYIAQSGSAFTTFPHNGCRLNFNLAVSSGNEMVTSVADYMDWSLEQDDTRVIGLFLEAVRDPAAFVAALQKAVQKQIPVVVLKIGKSPLSAKMAMTHTGAIAGDHAAYEALFRKYGVIEVSDLDEMVATLMMLQHAKQIGAGALATLQESGGFRELVTDIAFELDVPFAEIEDTTKSAIQNHLDPGLKAENPLDVWGSHDRFEERFLACTRLLMADPNVATGIFFSNFRDGYYLSDAIYRVMETVSKESAKPVAMANCYSDLAHNDFCKRSNDSGFAFIDGTRETLLAVNHLFAYRDFKNNHGDGLDLPSAVKSIVDKWRARLEQTSGTLGEVETLNLLSDFSIAVPKHLLTDNAADLARAAQEIGYPLVLKTAMAGINHKSDVGGVIVNIENEASLLEHYHDLANRQGPEVLLSQMIDRGTEVGLGIINDAQFGPLVMVAAGGVLIELLSERSVALAPVSKAEADELISPLKLNKLINGVRGQAAGNRQALIEIISSLSVLAFELKDCIQEIDINPVIVNQTSAIAVDALIVISPEIS
jgi:acyl-CoA synthetase (NDP forming)